MYFIILFGILYCAQNSQSHLLYPINYCILAQACVHDSRQICAATADGCTKRQFIDQCDMYEYNCDFGARYEETFMLHCFDLVQMGNDINSNNRQTESITKSTLGWTTWPCGCKSRTKSRHIPTIQEQHCCNCKSSTTQDITTESTVIQPIPVIPVASATTIQPTTITTQPSTNTTCSTNTTPPQTTTTTTTLCPTITTTQSPATVTHTTVATTPLTTTTPTYPTTINIQTLSTTTPSNTTPCPTTIVTQTLVTTTPSTIITCPFPLTAQTLTKSSYSTTVTPTTLSTLFDKLTGRVITDVKTTATSKTRRTSELPVTLETPKITIVPVTADISTFIDVSVTNEAGPIKIFTKTEIPEEKSGEKEVSSTTKEIKIHNFTGCCDRPEKWLTEKDDRDNTIFIPTNFDKTKLTERPIKLSSTKPSREFLTQKITDWEDHSLKIVSVETEDSDINEISEDSKSNDNTSTNKTTKQSSKKGLKSTTRTPTLDPNEVYDEIVKNGCCQRPLSWGTTSKSKTDLRTKPSRKKYLRYLKKIEDTEIRNFFKNLIK